MPLHRFPHPWQGAQARSIGTVQRFLKASQVWLTPSATKASIPEMKVIRLVVIYLAIYAVLSLSGAFAGDSGGRSHYQPRVNASGICVGYGPQAPRDITRKTGINRRIFSLAPSYKQMNLCNIHMHSNAEHKGAGFSIFAGEGEHGGFKCNMSQGLSSRQLTVPEGRNAFKGGKPGDTIEVHWVFTSCDVEPGEGLGACMSQSCTNPQLRVEAQVFLLVNDRRALDFSDFDHDDSGRRNFHQPKRLPARTGKPVEYAGSTTGPKHDRAHCSPLQVTWSVRPGCAMLDINTLNEWAEHNAFGEKEAHGVRALVTELDLLSPIE